MSHPRTIESSSLENEFELIHVILLRFYLFIFRERGREGEREGTKHVQDRLVASHTPPTGDLAHTPGMCPDRESNLQPSSSQTSAQSTEPHQPEQVDPYF